MTGMRLNLTISDTENDQVQYNVFLNGNQVYPYDLTQTFSELTQSPVTYDRLFLSNEAAVGSNNTVVITAKDKYGITSTVSLIFVGEYSELMFADEAGNYYSTDLGEVLQYLDMDVLIAGQISETYPVRLINKTGYAVVNVLLSKNNKTLPTGAALEISQTESPFVPEGTILHSGALNYNDEFTFYVRIVTTLSSQPGQGEFDIYVTGDPA
jgi:hypothetical protein